MKINASKMATPIEEKVDQNLKVSSDEGRAFERQYCAIRAVDRDGMIWVLSLTAATLFRPAPGW